MKYVILLFLGFAFALSSCKKSVLFEQLHPINSTSWHQDSAIVFTPIITDTIASYNVLFRVKNTNDYQFSNLYLFALVQFPDGKTIVDTLEMVLANNRGKWIGDSWFGIFTTTFPYKLNVRFPKQGKYRFEIRQAMRCVSKSLDGIAEMGMLIQKRK